MMNEYNPSPEEQAAITMARNEWYAREREQAKVLREQWLNRVAEKSKPVTEAEIMELASGQKRAQALLRHLRGEEAAEI